MTGLIDEMMAQGIAQGVFPGAALLVASKGTILYRSFFGQASVIPHKEPVTEGTIWDIASLTKPVVTASLALQACLEKRLSLKEQVSRQIPEMAEDGAKKKITIRHLLKHTSGLPAWKPYYEEIERERPELLGCRESRQVYLAKISHEPLQVPISFRRIYSDLGFILLGILLEDLFEAPLDRLFAEKIAGPLGMKDTWYVPIGAKLPRPYTTFAATEESAWRKKLIRGEVHDDNAYALGGVAGHAGLFSTVDDLHQFLTAIETAVREGHPLFPRELVEEFIGPKTRIKLGWDTPSEEGSQAGRYFSKNSIGHLGYSGCSFWADLDRGFHVILLTNRVHPTAANEKIKEFRPKIHDLIEELMR